MKTVFSFLLVILSFSVLCLPNGIAQEHIKNYLPKGARARVGKGSVSEIVYSPDSTQLAVASSIGIWIYDARTGQELDLLTDHTGGVSSVCYSPDGHTIASGSSDRTV